VTPNKDERRGSSPAPNLNDDDAHELPPSLPASPAESDQFEDADDRMSDEEEDNYFTFPLPSSTSNPITEPATDIPIPPGDDDNDEDNGNPSDDRNWSGSDDLESDEDYGIETPRKRAFRKRKKRDPTSKRPPKRDPRVTNLSSVLRASAITTTDPSMHGCPTCHRHFKNESLFTSHIKICGKERHLKCPFPNCDKSYVTNSAFLTHKKSHEPEKYGKKCRICGAFFSRSDKVLEHQKACVEKMIAKGETVDPQIINDMQKRTKGRWSLEVVVRKKKNLNLKKRESPKIDAPVKCRICFGEYSKAGKAREHEKLCVKKAIKEGKHFDPAIIEDLSKIF